MQQKGLLSTWVGAETKCLSIHPKAATFGVILRVFRNVFSYSSEQGKGNDASGDEDELKVMFVLLVSRTGCCQTLIIPTHTGTEWARRDGEEGRGLSVPTSTMPYSCWLLPLSSRFAFVL